MTLPDELDLGWDTINALIPPNPDTSLMDEFFRHPVITRLIVQATNVCMRRYSVDRVHFEDFRSECQMMVLTMLTDESFRASAQRTRNGLGVATFYHFGTRVKSISESSEFNGSSGLSTRIRRGRALRRMEMLLTQEWGRTPSRSEVVAEYNARVSASRSNAAREGALGSHEDLTPILPASLDPMLEVPCVSHVDDMPMISVDARPLLTAVQRSAATKSSELRMVVDAWLGHFDDDPPYISTVAEIIAETGLDEQWVRQLYVQAMNLARQVMADEFAISR